MFTAAAAAAVVLDDDGVRTKPSQSIQLASATDLSGNAETVDRGSGLVIPKISNRTCRVPGQLRSVGPFCHIPRKMQHALSTICLRTWIGKRTWLVISTIFSKTKDFSGLKPVTYTVNVHCMVISRKHSR